LFALPAAAAGGWWLGTELDKAIGKLFNLRGELLSTEMALKAGESASSATTDSNALGQEQGSKATTDLSKTEAEQMARWESMLNAIIPGREGNIQRNNTEASMAAQERQRAGRMSGAAGFRADGGSGFNAVSGKLEVFVTDDRVRTKLSGNAGRLGQQEVR
jgi:hypothetical protein